MRGQIKRAIPIVVWQALLGIAVIASWQALVNAGKLDKFFFSRPTDIAVRIGTWIRTGSIFPHLLVTMEEATLAFILGGASGVLLGFGLARAPRLGALLDPYIRLLNALPRVVLAPIFLLWFGLGIWSKVVLGITVVFFIVFFNTHQGVREVDPVVLNNVRMLGASEWQLIRHVLIPSALTWVFSSLHISVGFAMIAVVVGEYLGASRGVGYLISQAEGTFDTTGVFAGMAVLSAVVLLVGWGVNRLERWLLRWKA
ncbi:MAG: ABC transporter permease [Bryobacteraceae bacterium]|jgi:NitT/TauT family transport system permease protein